MDTVAQNGSADGVANLNAAFSAAFIAPGISPMFVDFGHNNYILLKAEFRDFFSWLRVPHPTLNISCFLAWVEEQGGSPVATMSLSRQTRALANVTEEQDNRFGRVAEVYDIVIAAEKLKNFKLELDEIKDMFEARLEDESADFNAWDFKQLEKEDQRAK